MARKIKIIIAKYFSREATETDLDELRNWVKEPKNESEFNTLVKINHAIDINVKKFNSEDSKKKLLTYIAQDKKRTIFKSTTTVLKYAAILVLFFGLGYAYKATFIDKEKLSNPITGTVVGSQEDSILIGTDKAILTLSDGSQVALEKGKQVNVTSAKSTGNKLIYNPVKTSAARLIYNYLTIPKGGQFQIELSDGTVVWLNSDSQLKYPVEFIEGEERAVELVYGEAYFEVTPSTDHNGAKFLVKNKYQEIEVLGTEFNIKAYANEEAIYTTLVGGKVTIENNGDKVFLTPDQQAVLNLNDHKVHISKIDAANEIAWIKGVFSFKGKTLFEIAKVLERWYDIDIIFKKQELGSMKFNGVLRKTEPIETIMKSILSTNTINAYDIKNKTITIQ
ncbi:FecR family protein [Maribacter sp. LLG6340-A2]|uniref:FecR family protein n=1 Tax=Maribacter sp. LLG6340-A2 TaxID=3160834 RepID=UPI003868D6A4